MLISNMNFDLYNTFLIKYFETNQINAEKKHYCDNYFESIYMFENKEYYEIIKNIEKNVNVYVMDNSFNKPLENIIPLNTKYLIFGNNFNQTIKKNDIPYGVKYIKFGDLYNKPLNKYSIPYSVTHLIFGTFFNQTIDKYQLHNNIKYIKFGDCFNRNINNILPLKLRYISFGYFFNQNIEKNSLPNSIKYISFGDGFNKKLSEDILPNNIVYLKFGLFFNQSINDIIPNTVTHLFIGEFFKENLNLKQLSNIKYLINENNKNIYKQNSLFEIIYINTRNIKDNKPYFILDNNNNFVYHYFSIKYNIDMYTKIKIEKLIRYYEMNNMIGKVIFTELIKKVLHPTRLNNISRNFNISFENLIENY